MQRRRQASIALLLAALACALAGSTAGSASAQLGHVRWMHAPGVGTDLVFGDEGDLWYPLPESSEIARVSPSGSFTTFHVAYKLATIAVGQEGDIWFATFEASLGRAYLGRMTPEGDASYFPIPIAGGGGAEQLDFAPGEISTAPNGDIWFSASYQRRIPERGNYLSYERVVYESTPSGDVTQAYSSPHSLFTHEPVEVEPPQEPEPPQVIAALPLNRIATLGVAPDGTVLLGTEGEYNFPAIDVLTGGTVAKFTNFPVPERHDGQELDNSQEVEWSNYIWEYSLDHYGNPEYGFYPANQERGAASSGPAFDSSGNAWFAVENNECPKLIEYSDGQITEWPVTSTGLCPSLEEFRTGKSEGQSSAQGPIMPGRPVAGAEGSIWFADGGSSIYRVYPGSAAEAFPLGPVPEKSQAATPAVADGPNNELWFTIPADSGGYVGVMETSGADTAPTIAQQPASTTVAAPAAASFTVSCAGEPTPSVRWEESTGGPGGSYVTLQGQTSSTLAISPTTLAQNDTYYRATCTNPAGSQMSNAALLTVTEHLTGSGLTSMAPTTGPASGGTIVTIEGPGCFSRGTRVDFGERESPEVSVKSSRVLTAVAPPNETGRALVVVYTSCGTEQFTKKTYYTYGDPVITSITPTHGPVAGGTKVAIAGAGFSTSAGETTFAFGKKKVKAACGSPVACTVLTPKVKTSGAVPVSVAVGKAKSSGSTDGEFTYD